MVTVKRRTNEKIESVVIPESAPYKEAIEIYKMEYEKAAERYNNLYSAAWTNFSYMVLVAGGLLTFAGARFVTPLTVFLACLPLLFWWIATFEPLNRYGDKVEKELGDVEKKLNALCISEDFPGDARKGLTHFQNFAQRGQDQKVLIEKLWRVRYIVRVTGVMILVMTIGFGLKVGSLVMKGEPLTVKGEPLSVLVTIPTPTPTATPTSLPRSSPVLKSQRGKI
jgi:hypothetical protein